MMRASDIRDTYGFEVKREHLDLYQKYAPLWEIEERERAEIWSAFLKEFPCLTDSRQPRQPEDRSINSLQRSLDDWQPQPLSSPGDAPEWWQQLSSLVQAGVPMPLRGKMWKLFLHLDKKKEDGMYNKLVGKALGKAYAKGGSLGSRSSFSESLDRVNAEGSSEEEAGPAWHPSSRDWNLQIEKDLHRTFPGHPVMDGSGRSALRRILAAYSCRNPHVGYCQGMNFVAGCLLLFMEEEDAFWCLASIVEDLLPGYFSLAMIAPQVDQLVLNHLTAEYFPTLGQHLEQLGVNVSSVATQWFLCMFVNSLPLESCLRVWDIFFFERCSSVLFRVALALIDIYSQVLVATVDSMDAFTVLQTMAPMSYDSSRLIHVACISFAHVTSRQLACLRAIHRTSVLAQLQQRKARLDEKTLPPVVPLPPALDSTVTPIQPTPFSNAPEAKTPPDLTTGAGGAPGASKAQAALYRIASTPSRHSSIQETGGILRTFKSGIDNMDNVSTQSPPHPPPLPSSGPERPPSADAASEHAEELFKLISVVEVLEGELYAVETRRNQLEQGAEESEKTAEDLRRKLQEYLVSLEEKREVAATIKLNIQKVMEELDSAQAHLSEKEEQLGGHQVVLADLDSQLAEKDDVIKSLMQKVHEGAAAENVAAEITRKLSQ